MGKQIPLIRYSPLSGRYYLLTRYTMKDAFITAQTKHDITDQIETIAGPIARERDALLAACEAALARLKELEQTYLINRGHPNNGPEIEQLKAAIKLAKEGNGVG